MKSVMCKFVCETYTQLVADVFLKAKLRGLASHGVFRFPELIESIELEKLEKDIM